MRAPVWSELLRLPEGFAAQRYLEAANLATVRWLVSVSTIAAIVPLILLASEGRYVGAVAMFVVLAANLTLLLLRQRPVFRRQVSLFLFAHAVLLLLALAVGAPEPMVVWSLTVLVLSTVYLLAIRWRSTLLWTLSAVLLVTAGWAAFGDASAEPALPQLVLATLWIGGMALASSRMTRRRLDVFTSEYRRQLSSERERTRMRDELSDARAVQLSMLPQTAPELGWLDLASVSVPASEVGGDYYDYFVLDEQRIALVIGDVSGHGMASGLVLAAVRGGLHLLRRNLENPVEVLERLDGMLRATAPGRMFVTLQIVLIDRRSREIVVANAGHPPLIRLTGNASESVGSPGRPLGTNLGGAFGRQAVSFEPGDALVLYTDGVTELSNLHGDPFGPQRLEREAARKRTESSARALRDELLASLTHYRADAVQEDDMTLIVVGLEPGLGG